MTILLREAQPSDIPFLRKMLYEAVYWRAIANANQPSFEKGLADSEVSKTLANWGEREGDIAVVACVDTDLAGAAWCRYWTDDNFIRGYINKAKPVLVIAVARDYRRQGIGEKMIKWLLHQASKHNIQEISLMVSKDNHALHFVRADAGYFTIPILTFILNYRMLSIKIECEFLLCPCIVPQNRNIPLNYPINSASTINTV